MRPIRLAWIAAVMAACTPNPVPPGWAVSPEEAERTAFGSWLQLSRRGGGSDVMFGELIAVSRDSVFLLSPGNVFIGEELANVTGGLLVRYKPQTGDIGLWGGLGALSTISHGAFLVFTLPAWLIIGPTAAGSESRRPFESTSDWNRVARYARFPQGLPPTVHRNTLTRSVDAIPRRQLGRFRN